MRVQNAIRFRDLQISVTSLRNYLQLIWYIQGIIFLPISDKSVLDRIKRIRRWCCPAGIQLHLHVLLGPTSGFKVQPLVEVYIDGEIAKLERRGEGLITEHAQGEVEVAVAILVVDDGFHVRIKLGVGVTFGGQIAGHVYLDVVVPGDEAVVGVRLGRDVNDVPDHLATAFFLLIHLVVKVRERYCYFST